MALNQFPNRLSIKRISVATAIAVSAALLAAPGTAAARGVCSDLGANPMAPDAVGAPEAAGTCDSEARIAHATDVSGTYAASGPVEDQATVIDNDYNRDGFQDLVVVRESDGNLLFYAGRGDGTFQSPVSRGAGWRGMDVVMAGDLSSEGYPDLLARDTRTGYLYTYPGDGSGDFSARIEIGPGWNSMGVFTAGGDFDEFGYGRVDLIAVDDRDGKLYLYPGTGRGTFSARTAIDTSDLRSDWRGVDSLTTLGDSGGLQLMAREGLTGRYWLYRSDLRGGFSRLSTNVGSCLCSDPSGFPRKYTQVTAAGDVDGDGYQDVLGLATNGAMTLHSFTETNSYVHQGRIVSDGWIGIRLPVVYTDRTYDYDTDGAQDLVARSDSDGHLHVYKGSGTGGFGPVIDLGPDWNGLDLIETAGDLNSDGKADLLARKASTGRLYFYAGGGSGQLIESGPGLGSGWDTMSAIVSGHDYNLDGKVDIIAREASTGILWLYPGTGYRSELGHRIQIGNSWNAMRNLTGVGDLDHDGIPDMLAVRKSDNCLYFYGGRGDGLFERAVSLGCGWGEMNMVSAVGDFDGDGNTDWIARLASDGRLFLYHGNGAGDYSSKSVIGTSWSEMTIA